MLEFDPQTPYALRDWLGYHAASDALLDPRGRLVRLTPTRRTKMLETADGERIFCKSRRGRVRDAMAEWRALATLPALGAKVPTPVFLARRGAESALGMLAVPGRPMDVILVEEGAVAGLGAVGIAAMPSILRSLHDAGWFYRDMYWNHVFLDDREGVFLVDVERAFQPRWRRGRWQVKDLAGLLSSVPPGVEVSRGTCLRFLREYLGGLPSDGSWKALARRVVAKAARIVGHVTKYP